MDRSDAIILIGATYTTDSIGQRIRTDTYKTVYCNIGSVSGSEWFAGGQNGINPQYKVSMFKYDYSGETEVNIGGSIVNNALSGGKNYSVYRTYEAKDDVLELYLEMKAGVI